MHQALHSLYYKQILQTLRPNVLLFMHNYQMYIYFLRANIVFYLKNAHCAYFPDKMGQDGVGKKELIVKLSDQSQKFVSIYAP